MNISPPTVEYGLVSPMLIVLALVAGWPLIRTIYLGFTNANLADLSQTEWIGFENYLANYDGEWAGLLVDELWWRAVWNTVWFSVVSIALETVLGIVVALVLNAVSYVPGGARFGSYYGQEDRS